MARASHCLYLVHSDLGCTMGLIVSYRDHFHPSNHDYQWCTEAEILDMGWAVLDVYNPFMQ